MARPFLPEGTQKPISDIQKDSDAKRGVKPKSFKIPVAEHEFIDELAKQHGLKLSELLIAAMHHYAEHLDNKKAK